MKICIDWHHNGRMHQEFLPSHRIRARFAQAMSRMYRAEVPQYGALLSLVEQVNQQQLAQHAGDKASVPNDNGLHHLGIERHGAIRLGKAEELSTMRRLLAVMDMHPVAYYDLSEAGLPVHSTAFRPVSSDQLDANPFRLFISLLRLDLIDDASLRRQAETLLQRRRIFTPRVLHLIDLSELAGGLTSDQADEFVEQALYSFRWHQRATVSHQTYRQMLGAHPLLADIACLQVPHINHLTPGTLNIDEVHRRMSRHGMTPKDLIEGPPQRKLPILLRQTSFKAPQEPVIFIENGVETEGTHSARFGEVEQRGQALTPKGRQLYDRLLAKVRQEACAAGYSPTDYYRALAMAFASFPDDSIDIHRKNLGYFRYSAQHPPDPGTPIDLDAWIEQGSIGIEPIIYEDFLPVSAAGIFDSNLGIRQQSTIERSPNQRAFERDLGCPVISEFALYEKAQRESLASCLNELQVTGDAQRQLIDQQRVE